MRSYNNMPSVTIFGLMVGKVAETRGGYAIDQSHLDMIQQCGRLFSDLKVF
jgi:hypothetical protein